MTSRKQNLIASIILVVCVLFAGTANAQEKTGFLLGYYDRMQPVAKGEGAGKMRWEKPGVDFGKYKKIMLDHIVFYFAEDSKNKGIDADEMKVLADGCHLAMINVLKADYPIVAEPGPDVLRIRWAITDLRQSEPVIGVATTVLPVGLAFSLIKKSADDTWTGAGATTAEVMLIDSMTNDVLGVAQGDKSAEFGERYTKWGSAEEAFKYWANYIRLFLFSHTK